ncbi:caspase family protein [Bradyrhizobium canariense]|uniref:Caspase domain-containing protein n=1 Tax=Bradyrhizobium canariense TaxID=255045 RepID=A0A1H1R040_9BRAD|nr:caspase family protein [Bradyrhizobium canariense]SDS29012.1 Caspase domain-containing protein [Bradyrhizobium canariense]
MTNWLRFRAALVWSLAASLLALAAPAHAEKRVALVIGNNDYKNVPKLQKAVNDARTMGDTLKQLGFTVMVAENQTRQAFSESLLAFDKAVDPGDTAFFFYAGHGFEIAGQNFLLPIDVPAAGEGQEELVRDASVLADRIIERLQNKNVRTAILVFDACRNNPFERSGTRALAGGGGLAPMTQLPEGVFSVFSAGPRQTALDRLSNSDDNPNSVFTRTFAKELLKPGENLVQVAQHTRRIVSEMAETVSHKQIPVYFDQMVDDVFLNGVDKGPPEAAKETSKPVEPPQKVAALPPVSVPRTPPSDSVNAPIAMFSRHNGGWTVVFSIVDPALGISWRMGDAGEFRETGFLDTLDPRTRKRMPNPSIELAADAPAATIEVRYVDAAGELHGPFPIRFDPEAALIHDQRKILDMTATSWLSFREFNGLLVYYTQLMSYRCAIREARVGIDTTVPDKVLKMPPCDPKDPSVIPSDAVPFLKLPPATKSVSVELTYRDGSVSEIKSFRR